MTRSIHPFPARMAPELAINEVRKLQGQCTVLDPMVGSGTVVREASERGHRSLGFDVDPLAVLMSKVWTTPIPDKAIDDVAIEILQSVKRPGVVELSWIDRDPETKAFVDYWFARKQKMMLRRLAGALHDHRLEGSARQRLVTRKALDVLRIALSRIVVTKDVGASLARDVSHSRPHRVSDESDYDVLEGFERSLSFVRKALSAEPPKGRATVRFGDARHTPVRSGTIDLVLTSPPYLNAIDYLRGHRLALVWLGHSLAGLRRIRSEAIGSERGHGVKVLPIHVNSVQQAMTSSKLLSARHVGMIQRYAIDIIGLMREVRRTLSTSGHAVMVVGNSCLRGVFIRNSAGIVAAGSAVGLKLEREIVRELPESKRYLPLHTGGAALGKRMRTESVLTFANAGT